MYLKVIHSVDDEFGIICYNYRFFQIIIAPVCYRKFWFLELSLFSLTFRLSLPAIYSGSMQTITHGTSML